MQRNALGREELALDPGAAVEEIVTSVRQLIFRRLRRKGVVVGLSGGIDSSVVAALCVRALGRDRVLGLLMPERESAGETVALSRLVADHLGIEAVLEDITPILEAADCYGRRNRAISTVVPGYGPDWKVKIVLPSVVDSDRYRLFSVVAESPNGERTQARLTPSAYRELVAASNFKQRTRKMLEYYHADRLDYAVAGTPNRLEYDQGFFVKNGDGMADLKPIAHLYKTQVYQIAEYLDLPQPIRERPPTTDTYSLPQNQEEFYFSLPYDKMDLCLYARNHNIPASALVEALGLHPEQIERVFRDIDAKRQATRYLHLAPQLVEAVPEVAVTG